MKSTDERIAQILGRKGDYPITVEDGRDPLPSTDVANDVTHRIDPRIENLRAAEEREAARLKRAAVQEITQPSNVPDPAEVVSVGHVSIFPNPLLNTYEAQFTRHAQGDYIITVHGAWVSPSEGLAELYEALKASTPQARGSKK